MDFFSTSGEQFAGRFFMSGYPTQLHLSQKDASEKPNLAWTDGRSGLEDTQFDMFQAPKRQSSSPSVYETSPPHYPPHFLSPVSPDQAGPIHSPQIDSDPYDPVTPRNAFTMSSPTTEYEFLGNSYRHRSSAVVAESSFVNPYEVSRGSYPEQSNLEMNGFGSLPVRSADSVNYTAKPTFSEVFSNTIGPSNGTPDVIMAANTYPEITGIYPSERMEVDAGVPAMSPSDEDDNVYTAQPDHRGRTNLNRKRVNNKTTTKPAPKKSKIRPSAGASKGVLCKTCDEPFADSARLREHAQQAHARPLVCVFGYAGCTSTFGSKNEWKRHVLSQHIILTYWLCTDPACVKANPTSGGTVFNRKDLYTQHVRRMHVPDEYKDAVSNKVHTPDWTRQLQSMQENAERKRCEMPKYMKCPSIDCSTEFKGATAWDDRMEHVARHLDRAASPSEPRVVFGGDNDSTLTGWAESSEVNIVRRTGLGDTWKLVVPLKTTAKEVGSARRVAGSFRSGSGDDDADGESE